MSDQGVLSLYKATKGTDLKKQLQQWSLPDTVCDQFGPVIRGQQVHPDILPFSEPQQIAINIGHATFNLATLKSIAHLNVFRGPEDLSFHIMGYGPKIECKVAAGCRVSDVTVVTTRAQHVIGLMPSIVPADEGFHCVFTPCNTTCPHPQCTGTSNRIQFFMIKWLSRTLWKGTLAPEVTMEQLTGTLEVTLKPAFLPAMQRLISQGKRAVGPLTVAEMAKNTRLDCTLAHVGHSLHGGGTEQNRTQAKNALAATLLENG